MALVSLKPNSKGIVVLIIVAVVIFFGCILVYLGAAGKLRGVEAELEAKQKEVEKSKKIAETLEQSKLKFLDTQSQLRYLESSVSTQAYVPTLLKQLELLGKSVDLQVRGVRPEPKTVTRTTRRLSSGAQAAEGNVESASQSKTITQGKPSEPTQKPYDELKVDLELKGKYMDVLDFLHKLTSFPKIIAVNNLDMKSAGQLLWSAANSPSLDIKLTITAFVLREDESVTKPRVPPSASSVKKPTGEGRTANEAG